MLNMLINSAIIRKREFALLQAVGMTQKQLKQMLYQEGLNISIKAVLLSAILGIAGGKALCYIAEEVMSFKFIVFQFTVWPIIVFAVVLIGLQMLISNLIIKNEEKDTLTERLKTS